MRNAIFGPLFTRPVDSMLNRISDNSLQTQPPSLRHRAIVRDSSIKERAMFYLYRTFDNFQKAVDLGETSWEAVGPTDISALEKPKLDKWGFAEVQRDLLQVKDGSATLAACSEGLQVYRYKPRASDPSVKKQADGTWVLSWNRKGARAGRPTATLPKSRNAPRPAIRRTPDEEIPEEEIPKDDFKAPQGPEMIRGLTRQEYNRQYQLKLVGKNQRKQRIPQLKRYATWLARKEAAEELNKAAAQSREIELPDREVLDRDQQEVTSSSAPPIRPEFSLKRRAKELLGGASPKRHQTSQPDNQDVMVPIQRTDGKGDQAPTPLPQGLEISPDRVSELIEHLQDTTIPGVHVNPVGSLNYLPRGRKTKGRRFLVVSFRFDWLCKFDWFVSSAPVRPPEPESTENETGARESMAAEARNEGREDLQLPTSKQPSEGHIPLSETESEDSQTEERSRPPEKRKNPPRTPRKSLWSAVGLDENHDYQETSNMAVAGNSVMPSGPANAEKEIPANQLYTPQDQVNQDLDPNQLSPDAEPEANNKQSTPGLSELRDHAENGLLKTPQPVIPKNSTPVLLSKGSARFKRTRLLLDLVDQCDGIIGADKEMALAFQHEQKKRNEQVADRSTIARAVKNLVDQGKLQRVVVVFNDQKGKAVTKPILLRPGVSINSQAAKDTIKKMEEHHPLLYIPLDVPQELKITKKAISRYSRTDDTITFQPASVHPPDEEIPPWEAYFHSRKRILADRRNERFKTRKKARLAKNDVDKEPINEAPSPDTSMQDVSMPGILMEPPADPTNERAYTFVIMGIPDGQHVVGHKGPNDEYMESSRRRRRLPGEFFGSNANEQKEILLPVKHNTSKAYLPQDMSFIRTAAPTPRRSPSPEGGILLSSLHLSTMDRLFGNFQITFLRMTLSLHFIRTPREEALADRPTAFRLLDPKCVITPKAAKMLLYACVAIRTLAGGKDRSMNWTILDQVFADYPHYQPTQLQESVVLDVEKSRKYGQQTPI